MDYFAFQNCDGPNLNAKDIYAPQVHTGSEFFAMLQARALLKNKIYKLLKTPYLTNLQLALDQSLDRPVTYHNRCRYLFMICCIEQLFYPILTILVIFYNAVRYFYLYNFVSSGAWSEVFILQTSAITIPLLPLTFPGWWMVLNSFGMARFKALSNFINPLTRHRFVLKIK